MSVEPAYGRDGVGGHNTSTLPPLVLVYEPDEDQAGPPP